MGPPLVVLEGVRKAFGTRVLLDGVTAGVPGGERIGVVGRNGGGKTTLLEVLTGREPVDAGRVTAARDLRVALLQQGDELPPGVTVREVVLGDRLPHEWAGDARVRDVLGGLLGGLEVPGLPQGLDSAVGTLSGGERRRVALARLLLDESDLLVLDEPTNHLDVEAVDWLARHLAARQSGTRALVVVTHDRWFLDATCTRTWEVANGAIHEYEGGYAAYVLAKAERTRVAASEEARRQNLLRKELAWLRRGPPARTSKPRFRIDAANALIEGEPPARDTVELVRFASARLGRSVYGLQDVSLRVGADKVLLDRVTWQVGPGDRVGVVGVNGAGKTSLLRLLVGSLQPDAGQVERGLTVRPAYLSQEVGELPPDRRVLETVQDVRQVLDLGNGRQLTATSLCERFGFVGERQWTPVRDLSGGERRRLQLLRLLMTEPNVLLLDEPTNDLDIETLNALEDLLDGWAGTLLVVSHDRYFLERVCDRTVALLGDGQLRELPGGVEEYLARRRSLLSAQTAAVAGVVAPRAGDSRAARRELARIERQLDRLTAREGTLHEQLAAAASDYEKAAVLDADLRGVSAEREELEERWLLLAEEAG
ncbi:MAG: ATP-binding cassette domain-containing protein [Actinomycetota bacterium]|nr:ATP-binding cassette domain-containing protein [Actinomycetota bacterium]